VATLGFSRATFVRFTTSEQFIDWRDGLIGAFEYFGGVPQEVLPDYVSEHIIWLMCRSPLCARVRQGPAPTRRCTCAGAHNVQSVCSHLSRSWSCRQWTLERDAAEGSTGGKHNATAVCFIRRLISA
jgi:transposase